MPTAPAFGSVRESTIEKTLKKRYADTEVIAFA